MLMAVPRWSGFRLLINSRTGFGKLIALDDEMIIGTEMVPFWFWKAFGSTRTCTVAGVTPPEGEIVTPVWSAETRKSVLPPPGLVIVRLTVIAFRLQKLPLATRSL